MEEVEEKARSGAVNAVVLGFGRRVDCGMARGIL
jgi:hypothetical protein